MKAIARKDKVLRMFLTNVRKIREIERIYLFGSRTRKIYRPDSDYDLLIVVKNMDIKDKLYDTVVDVFCKTDADISLKILKKDDYERLSALPTPFMEKIMREGVRIG